VLFVCVVWLTLCVNNRLLLSSSSPRFFS